MAWHDVAAQELADGAHPVRLADGRRIVLLRRGRRYWALRDICPHQGARLSSGVMADRVRPCRPGQPIELSTEDPVAVCPWHGWAFAADSGCSSHDPTVRVRSYPVRIDDGRVWIDA